MKRYNQPLTSRVSLQDPTKIPQGSRIFLPRILPGLSKTMKKYLESPRFLPGNSEIQESRNSTGKSMNKAQFCQNFWDTVPDFSRFFRIFQETRINQDPSELLLKVLNFVKFYIKYLSRSR